MSDSTREVGLFFAAVCLIGLLIVVGAALGVCLSGYLWPGMEVPAQLLGVLCGFALPGGAMCLVVCFYDIIEPKANEAITSDNVAETTYGHLQQHANIISGNNGRNFGRNNLQQWDDRPLNVQDVRRTNINDDNLEMPSDDEGDEVINNNLGVRI